MGSLGVLWGLMGSLWGNLVPMGLYGVLWVLSRPIEYYGVLRVSLGAYATNKVLWDVSGSCVILWSLYEVIWFIWGYMGSYGSCGVFIGPYGVL